MKKLILLVGIFLSSTSFGQLTGTQEEINEKAEIVAERAYKLLTEDLLSNRDEFEKYLTTIDNEYNTNKTGIEIKVTLDYFLNHKVLDGDYNDYVDVITSSEFMPIHEHPTKYEIKYVDGLGGYYLIIKITDLKDNNEHHAVVGFFDDLSIKSLYVVGYTNKFPLCYRDKTKILYTSQPAPSVILN